jgi:hypothetical protein
MKIFATLPFAFLALASPALAEVKAQSELGFAVVHGTEVKASPDALWKRLVAPKDWWNPAHSWSGSTAGFYIDAQAGGCFCELFQEKDKDGKLRTVGSVEHMRVVFSDPGKVLRLRGSLGPLQSEAMTGTLSISIVPGKIASQSRISFAYVVGGFMRYKTAEISPAVDKMLGEQFARLIAPFERTSGDAAKAEGEAPARPVEPAAAKPGGTSIDMGDIDEKAADEAAAKASGAEQPDSSSPQA